MSEAQPPASPSKDEVPLEDIDKLLAAEDPEFTKSLEEVRAVEADKSVTIEASAIDETMAEEAAVEPSKLSRIGRIKLKVRTAIANFKLRLRTAFASFLKGSIVFLKTKPKEFFFFSLAMSKVGFQAAKAPVVAFFKASRLQQVGLLTLVAMMAGSVAVLLGNMRGIWIPHLTEPVLTNLSEQAAFVETYDPKDGAESFYTAFPQEIHEFLFKKMKVNLRRTSDNPNPMGAFEIVVEVDSKDSAVEVRDREVELHDQLQRLLEEESYNDLDSQLGKERLKGRIKRELNDKLTQGWIKDVRFRTFVLKP